MYAFKENQGCKVFSRNLAQFVNHPPCYGRDLPAATSGTHGVLPGILLLFRAVPS